MTVLISVTHIIDLISKYSEQGDPLAVLAAAEWVTLLDAIMRMDHLINHVSPAALNQALEATEACTNEKSNSLH